MAGSPRTSGAASSRPRRVSPNADKRHKTRGNAPASGEPVEATGARGDEPEVQFEVTVLDGDAGRRLAVLQAEVILDLLTWLHQHRTASS